MIRVIYIINSKQNDSLLYDSQSEQIAIYIKPNHETR